MNPGDSGVGTFREAARPVDPGLLTAPPGPVRVPAWDEGWWVETRTRLVPARNTRNQKDNKGLRPGDALKSGGEAPTVNPWGISPEG